MADHEIAPGGSSDDVARLHALMERQHELWTLLRNAEDEATRNQFFDELTANRREIAALKDKAMAQGEELPEGPRPGRKPEVEQPARSVGEQLRAQIFRQPAGVAPPQPPPPPPPPPIVINTPLPESTVPESPLPTSDPARAESGQTALEETPAEPPAGPTPPTKREQSDPEPVLQQPAAEPVVPEPPLPEPAVPEPPVPEPVVPMQVIIDPPPPALDPDPTEDSSPTAGEPQPEPEIPQAEPHEPLRNVAVPGLAPEPTPYRSRADDIAALRRELAGKEKRGPKVSDEVLEKRRLAAHDRYESISRVRPQQSRVFPVIAILVAVVAVAAAIWYSFFFDRSTSAAPPVTVTTTTTTTTEAPAALPEDIVGAIQDAVDALGLGAVGITEQVGTIVLSGFVNSESDRQAVIGAAQELAGTRPVDASRLELTPTDEEIREAVLQVLGADSFDGVDVATTDGVAILTGVVDAEDRADLTGAVAAVDGVGRVVDATQTRNMANELAAEVRRIGGPDPIVYESGQLDPTAAQRGTLDEIAEAILAHPGPIVTLAGYTDPAGGAAENQQISQVRADLVRNYLVTQGVPASRVVADGRGEEVPPGIIFPVGLERRIEFEIGYARPPGVATDFRIAIVAPSARSDGSFTQSMVQAADLLAVDSENIGIDIAAGTTVEAAESALRSFAASGYDLIVAHGAGYGEAVRAVATEFPGISFLWGPGSDTFDLLNVSAYDVAAGEGAYVLGAIAASVTSRDVVGIVGSLQSGESRRYVDGFAAGVAATDSGIEVLTAYTGSTSDVALAAAAAATHLEAGADVLTGTDAMAGGARTTGAESNALWFGNQADQSVLAENLVVASQVYHWEVVLRQVVNGLDQGTRGGQVYTLNLGNGGLSIAYNPGYALALDVIVAADTVIGEITSGTLIVGG